MVYGLQFIVYSFWTLGGKTKSWLMGSYTAPSDASNARAKISNATPATHRSGTIPAKSAGIGLRVYRRSEGREWGVRSLEVFNYKFLDSQGVH